MAVEFMPTLFDSVEVVQHPEDSEEAFNAFRRRNPWFISRLATMAYEARSRGAKRVSMKALFELLRVQVPDTGSPYRLNNNWTALAARQVMEAYPDLDGVFALRKRKGES